MMLDIYVVSRYSVFPCAEQMLLKNPASGEVVLSAVGVTLGIVGNPLF